MTSFQVSDVLDFGGGVSETSENYSKFPAIIFTQFIPYIDFHNENPLH